jgi:hypothetical protein
MANYLSDARVNVKGAVEATKEWRHAYDGRDPPSSCLSSKSSIHCLMFLVYFVVCKNFLTLGEGGVPRECYQVEVATDALAALSASKPIETATSSGYTSLALNSSPSPSTGAPLSLTAEEDREFWNLMCEPPGGGALTRAVLRRLRQVDEMSDSSMASNGSGGGGGPRRTSVMAPTAGIESSEEDVADPTVNSLGCFMDFLLEKIELIPNSSLATNLLVTSILTQLACYPQPLLRSILTMTDLRLQPGVRSLPVAVAALRTRLDNVMPTLAGADEAIAAARKFLEERVNEKPLVADTSKSAIGKRMATPAAVAATISHIGRKPLHASFSV